MSEENTTDSTRITILVDNAAQDGCVAEHGFSLWVEAGGRRILFDTGQGGALESNADALGIRLSAADFVVLSHGHSDHTGGLARALGLAGKAVVCCHPGIVHPRYAVRDGQARSLRMPPAAMAAMDRLSWEQVRWVQSSVMLTRNIGLIGPIPRHTGYEDTGGPFFLDAQGQRPDLFDDETALWIRTDRGAVVCVGCAHAGLINTLEAVRQHNDGIRIRAVIGGFHLLAASDSRLERTIASLEDLAPDMIVPCHCTGERAGAEFARAFGARCRPGMAGMAWSF